MSIFGMGGFGNRGGYGRPRRMGGRWIIALIIAGIGLFSYFSKPKVTNPETGESYRVAMSVDEEKALGLRAAPEMAAKMGGAVDPQRDPAAARVAEMGKKIVQSSGARDTPYAGNFNFHLLDDPKTVNAFALPGGQIFITRALFNQLQNEAQLAGVLGHEIGHVIGQHSARQMAKGQLGQMLATAVGVGASEEAGMGGMVAAQMANQMLQLRYGRSDESGADTIGLKYMTQAGYDPSAMVEVMNILEKAMGSGGTRQPEFMSSHPHPDTRRETIARYLAENFPNGVPTTLTQGQPLHGGGNAPRTGRDGIEF